MKKICSKSFTLVEMLLVLVIIGIICAFAIPKLESTIWKSRFAEVNEVVAAIARAKIAYQVETQTYKGIPPYPYADCLMGNGIPADSTRIQKDLSISLPSKSYFLYCVYPSEEWQNVNFIYFKQPGTYDWAWAYDYTTGTWYECAGGLEGPARKYFTPPSGSLTSPVKAS